jgi:transcriptional regulator with XRE-family HTH domain
MALKGTEMKLGNKIRVFRQIKGYSQEVMAENLGISNTGYAKMERGESKITEERLQKIANILGITTEDLQNFDEKMIFKDCNNSKFTQFGYNYQQHTDFEHERQAYQQTIEILKAQNMQQQEIINQLLIKLSEKK